MVAADVQDMFGGTWVDIGNETLGSVAQAGFQDVTFTEDIVGTDLTGLAVAAQTFTVDVDTGSGSPQTVNVSYTPAALGESFNDLVTAVNVDLGAFASMAIVGGRLRITSATPGANSNILISLDELFDECTNYSAVETAVAGTAAGHTVKLFKRTA
jgi:hypothetical protein